MLQEIECPHCYKDQDDCTNGGDPGEWWENQYIPDGLLETECDGCGEKIEIIISWNPSFEAVKPE